MIVTEEYMARKDGVVLMKTYSDRMKMILQIETGNRYSAAVDISPVIYHYNETEEDIPDGQ